MRLQHADLLDGATGRSGDGGRGQHGVTDRVALHGRIPERVQPYATVVTKNYSDDDRSDLDHPGRYRVNISVDRADFADLTGHRPDEGADDLDFSEADRVLPHPVCAAQSWICVVNPGRRTLPTVLRLLAAAHAKAAPRTPC